MSQPSPAPAQTQARVQAEAPLDADSAAGAPAPVAEPAAAPPQGGNAASAAGAPALVAQPAAAPPQGCNAASAAGAPALVAQPAAAPPGVDSDPNCPGLQPPRPDEDVREVDVVSLPRDGAIVPVATLIALDLTMSEGTGVSRAEQFGEDRDTGHLICVEDEHAQGCHGFIDMADALSRALQADALSRALRLGSSSAFKKLRKEFNGDPTIRYKCVDDRRVTVPAAVLGKMELMIKEAADDNLERPFFIIFDEERLVCLDLVVGAAGDEGSCEHSAELVDTSFALCQSLQERTGFPLRLSAGHTHPVFAAAPVLHACGGLHSWSAAQHTERKFGALPSNVKSTLQEWEAEIEDAVTADTQAGREYARAIQEHIIAPKPRVYKKHCADYVESYFSSHVAGFMGRPRGCSERVPGSRFHWIVTPRLRQIGVFETPQDDYGAVIYYHWRIEEE
jgi:hypothetical protein